MRRVLLLTHVLASGREGSFRAADGPWCPKEQKTPRDHHLLRAQRLGGWSGSAEAEGQPRDQRLLQEMPRGQPRDPEPQLPAAWGGGSGLSKVLLIPSPTGPLMLWHQPHPTGYRPAWPHSGEAGQGETLRSVQQAAQETAGQEEGTQGQQKCCSGGGRPSCSPGNRCQAPLGTTHPAALRGAPTLLKRVPAGTVERHVKTSCLSGSSSSNRDPRKVSVCSRSDEERRKRGTQEEPRKRRKSKARARGRVLGCWEPLPVPRLLPHWAVLL